MKLSDLHARNPYQGFKPKKLDLQGWQSDEPAFRRLIEQVRPGLIIEVGTWKGASAIHMLEQAKELDLAPTLVCVDTWLGSLEFWTVQDDDDRYQSLHLQHGYPSVYETFLGNVVRKGFEDQVIPFPNTSLIAARWMEARGVQADLVYLDASHDEPDVRQDLDHWIGRVRPGGVLFGDDFTTFESVRRALDAFCTQTGRTYGQDGGKWFIQC